MNSEGGGGKNRSNSITSLQNMSSDNIEERDIGNRTKPTGQSSARNIKKPQHLQQSGNNNNNNNNSNANNNNNNYGSSNNNNNNNSNYDDDRIGGLQQQQQQLKKKKDVDLPSVSIVPGYKNFILDDNNAAYDSIADMFSKDEIEQAFKILDYQGNNQITVEELTFFLESIGEQARPEEIEEMIKMCDLEGKGYVSREEFFKLASGQSLAPIGQAYPPTEEMLKKKEILENINLDDFQMQKYKNAHGIHSNKNAKKPVQSQATTQQQQQQQQMSLQQQQMQMQANAQNQQMPHSFQQQNFLPSNTNNDFSMFNQSKNDGKKGQSMQNPNVTTNQGMITMLNATNANKSNVTTLGSTIQSKKEADNKMKLLQRWQKECKITTERLTQFIKSINEMFHGSGDEDPDVSREFKDFLKFIGVSPPAPSNGANSASVDYVELQRIFCEGVWWADGNSNPQEGIVNIIEGVMMMVGSSPELNSMGKYEMAFSMFDKEMISLEEVFAIERALTLRHAIPDQKIKTKYLNHRNKKENKAKNFPQDEMDKAFFLDMIVSYPTCFFG